MQEQSNAITSELPPEFVRLCEIDGIDPALILRGFIADVCGITGWLHVPRAYFWRAALHCLQRSDR